MIESCVVREGKLSIACRMSLAAVIVDRLVVLVSVTLLLVSQSVSQYAVCVYDGGGVLGGVLLVIESCVVSEGNYTL